MRKSSTTKIQSIGIMLVLTILIAIPFSCKKMDKFNNIDEKALPYGAYVPAALLQTMEENIIKLNEPWTYQLQQNLNADCFSQQMATNNFFGSNQNNTTYSFRPGWNNEIPRIFQSGVMDSWLNIKAATKDKDKDPDLYSISLILKVLAASRVTDVFGPIPYTKYGQGTNVGFDSQQALYNEFFTELKYAIETLTSIETSTPNQDAKWTSSDKSNLGGDYKNWVKLANTLRLRLAMRISKADPGKAKDEAQGAANNSFGFLETIPFSILGSPNPVWVMSGSYDDMRFGAVMESLLKGYGDPRLTLYALPATDPDPNIFGKIIGIRQGILLTDKTTYQGYSRLNLQTSTPVKLMSQAESFFLRAEGALNSWNMNGSAKDLYEKGIAASFSENGLDASDVTKYFADITNNKASAYVDPKNPANDVPLGTSYLSTSPKIWSTDATQNLEQIITQKYIAVFPEGMEAWTEFRRTGFPKLWPLIVNYSTVIPKNEFVKRLSYTDLYIKSSQYSSAVALLGGPDNENTKLWWNK